MTNFAKKHTVAIVLCTYNGSRYLPDQLASISSQTIKPDALIVRDDGSTDTTIEIVKLWSQNSGIPVHWVPSNERLGPARSFLTAIAAANEYSFYFFCDQDDHWLPQKIERAVTKLACLGPGPALYASRLTVVNENLAFQSESSVPKGLGLESALYESVLTGCTMAFNLAFQKLLRRDVPRNAVMHDWWCYLLASSVGKIVFDPSPTLLYRQHSQNAIGANRSRIRQIKSRLFNFFSPKVPNQRSRQVAEFLAIYYDEIPQSNLTLISMIADPPSGFLARARVARSTPVRRQHTIDTMSTRLAILTRRL